MTGDASLFAMTAPATPSEPARVNIRLEASDGGVVLAQLARGRTHQIEIVAEETADPSALALAGSFALDLQSIVPTVPSTVVLSPSKRRVRCAVEIPADFQADHLEVHVLGNARRLATHRFVVDAADVAAPVEVRAAGGFEPATPTSLAFLTIEPGPNQGFTISGDHDVHALASEPMPGLLADLEERLNEGQFKTLLTYVRGFARRRKAVRDWLGALAALPTPPRLVIRDHAGCNVPWELFEIDHDGAKVPMGARLAVVRWTEIIADEGDVELDLEAEEWSGSGVAYVDPELQVEAEGAVLAALGAPSGAIVDLWDALLTPPAGLGVYFMACHGQFEDNIHGQKIATISMTHLEARADDERIDALFIASACSSARLKYDVDILGLPAVLLAKYVKAYVGTLAPVHDATASRIGAAIVEALGKGPCDVPELLRRMRADVEDDASDETRATVFLYTYFGPPFVRVKLVGSQS